MKISHIPKNQNATSSRLGLLEFGALESATFFIVCARFEVDYKQVGSAGFTVSEGGQYIMSGTSEVLCGSTLCSVRSARSCL